MGLGILRFATGRLLADPYRACAFIWVLAKIRGCISAPTVDVSKCLRNQQIIPSQYVALLAAVQSGCNYGAICFQSDSVPGTGGDGHNIRPITDVALTVLVVSHGNHSAVRFSPTLW